MNVLSAGNETSLSLSYECDCLMVKSLLSWPSFIKMAKCNLMLLII